MLFPYSYIGSFFSVIAAHPRIEIITYDDLCWQENDEELNRYPQEYAAWRKQLATGKSDPEKIYILIQHDTDSGPAQTGEFVLHQMEIGIRSSVMTFARRGNPARNVAPTAYPINFDLLAAAQRRGFTIGYHCNAYHNAEFRAEEVYDTYDEDVDLLSKHFPVRFFSAHGGPAGPDGRFNRSFDYLKFARRKLLWVHNGATPRFMSSYSDGGLLKRLLADDPTTDLREWVRTLQQGQRYRILVHPQYYSDTTFRVRPDITARWYLDVLKITEHDAIAEYWDSIFDRRGSGSRLRSETPGLADSVKSSAPAALPRSSVFAEVSGASRDQSGLSAWFPVQKAQLAKIAVHADRSEVAIDAMESSFDRHTVVQMASHCPCSPGDQVVVEVSARLDDGVVQGGPLLLTSFLPENSGEPVLVQKTRLRLGNVGETMDSVVEVACPEVGQRVRLSFYLNKDQRAKVTFNVRSILINGRTAS